MNLIKIFESFLPILNTFFIKCIGEVKEWLYSKIKINYHKGSGHSAALAGPYMQSGSQPVLVVRCSIQRTASK